MALIQTEERQQRTQGTETYEPFTLDVKKMFSKVQLQNPEADAGDPRDMDEVRRRQRDEVI